MASRAVRSGRRAGKGMAWGRSEKNQIRGLAMTLLGNGLYATNHHEESLSVQRPSCLWSSAVAASKRYSKCRIVFSRRV